MNRVIFACAALCAATDGQEPPAATDIIEPRCTSASQLSALNDLITTNRWQDAVRLVAPGQECDWSDTARTAVAAIKREAEDLILLLDKDRHKISEISPAFQWAQNATHIFLNVKYAARWAAPGALELSETPEVNFTACCFSFVGLGEHSGVKKRYTLHLNFSEDIHVDSGSWSANSVGKFGMTVAKAKPGKWHMLLQKGSKLKNYGPWIDLQERWNREEQKLIENNTSKNASKKNASKPEKEVIDKPADKKKKVPSSLLSRGLKRLGVSKAKRKWIDGKARAVAPWACLGCSLLVALWSTTRRSRKKNDELIAEEDLRASSLAAAEKRQQAATAAHENADLDATSEECPVPAEVTPESAASPEPS